MVAADDGDRAWSDELYRFQCELGLDVRAADRPAAPGSSSRTSPRACAPGSGLPGRPPGRQPPARRAPSSTRRRRAGVPLAPRPRSRALESPAGAVSGVRLPTATTCAPARSSLAAGCWSGSARRRCPPGRSPPVRPVKGQILRLRPASAAPAARRGRCGAWCRARRSTSSPAHDGTVVVGATVEERGFDTTVTAGAVYELLRDAHRVVPGVTEIDPGRGHAPGCARARPTTPPSWAATGPVSTAWWWPPATTATGSSSPRSPPTAVAAVVAGERAAPTRWRRSARAASPRAGARRHVIEVPCWTGGSTADDGRHRRCTDRGERRSRAPWRPAPPWPTSWPRGAPSPDGHRRGPQPRGRAPQRLGHRPACRRDDVVEIVTAAAGG